MKNSFSLLEIILTLIISSIVIIYSTLFTKELFFSNKNNQNIDKSLSNQEINENRKEDVVSNIDFSIFEEKWNDIKLEMKNKEAVVNALMMNTYPDRMENNDLIIMFPNGNKFHKENIMQADKKIKVENIINKICGTNIKIKGEVEGEPKKNSGNDFVNKVLTFFDGEILEKK